MKMNKNDTEFVAENLKEETTWHLGKVGAGDYREINRWNTGNF